MSEKTYTYEGETIKRGEMSADDWKKAKNKLRRDVAKAKKKAANVRKVTKSTKKTTNNEASKKKEPPKPSRITHAKDVWHAMELEKDGRVESVHPSTLAITWKDDNPTKGQNKSKKARKVSAENRLSRHRSHKRRGLVCVETRNGDHVRVNRRKAEEIVSDGGLYLAKKDYIGKKYDPVSGHLVPAEWEKKT